MGRTVCVCMHVRVHAHVCVCVCVCVNMYTLYVCSTTVNCMNAYAYDVMSVMLHVCTYMYIYELAFLALASPSALYSSRKRNLK